MHAELRTIWEHMLRLGLGALAHANWHANFHSFQNRHWPELSVLQAAHAAELLVKARIAQEHPLLIFEQVPRSSQVDGEKLDLRALFEKGRTIQYADLPERLWSATGTRIENLDMYATFGRLRNCIQHFAAPHHDCGYDAAEFIYGVIDPFINEHWGLFAVDYNEDHEPYTYLVQNLFRRYIHFRVSPKAAACLRELEFEGDADDGYSIEMQRRFDEARAADAHPE